MTYLKRGKRGWRVKALQRRLINLSYNCGPWGVDGIFGPATERALKKFQSEHKDSSSRPLAIDGIYGPKTRWALLNPTRSAYIPLKPQPKPAGKKICVDAGHGGLDPGAVGPDGTAEADLNLGVAKVFEKVATEAGFNVVMTRTTDVYIPLRKRALSANTKFCSLFVSFHHNSATSTSARGTETFYWGRDRVRYSKTGEKLAKLVQEELIKHLHSKDRGHKLANFQVLRETKMTAILVEGGFVSNREELEFLQRSATRELIARATLKGIQRYYKLI